MFVQLSSRVPFFNIIVSMMIDLVGSTSIEDAKIDMLADRIKDYYAETREWRGRMSVFIAEGGRQPCGRVG